MNNYYLDVDDYTKKARQAASEGCVLLKNNHQTLPIRKGDNVAVFGRGMLTYYKSGLGSGGLVNTTHVTSILDALLAEESISVNSKLMKTYESWSQLNPVDHGEGWGKVPWSQKEMPLDQDTLEAAKEVSDMAIVLIARTAGEDQDNHNEAGAYLLSEIEESLIERVSNAFERTVVVLNVGNLIDMKWVAKYKPSAVLYAWQGGQEGGDGVADVLMGRCSPSGKLTSTIAGDISEYPSSADFGDPKINYYKEDIYVGYRYFETFNPSCVLYPFGFGLSYTKFSVITERFNQVGSQIEVGVKVENVGAYAGKEVVQVYVEAPQGRLGKSKRVLVAFKKTGSLKPGESTELSFVISKNELASFDDSGVTGFPFSKVLEEGSYTFYAGTDVRSAVSIGSIYEPLQCIEKLTDAYGPKLAFNRMKPVECEGDHYELMTENVPLSNIDMNARISNARGQALDYTGDQGYELAQVYRGEVTLDDFVAQLSEEEMACLFRGEGMCSPKVTAGTAGAFGGVTESLKAKGIPIACCADGPSGIRMDCGTKAFSLPNGTAIGSTFNLELVEELFAFLGLEVRKNKIDTILGPGINIQRNPLNGRNFEYIGEDPYLTGAMSVAQLKGLHKAGVTGTIKHFVANNQEVGRRTADIVVSQRALREIYLKAFEMSVKEGQAYAVMTSYGPVNHLWTAGSYDLNTTILRDEWGFDGLVMTDWWAEANFEGNTSIKGNVATMIRAQNDLFMVSSDALTNANEDNTIEMLEKGYISLWEMQRSTKNILGFIMRSPVMLHKMGLIEKDELEAMKVTIEGIQEVENLHSYRVTESPFEIDTKHWVTQKEHSESFTISVRNYGNYQIRFKMKSDLTKLAQLPMTIYLDDTMTSMVSVQGSEGEWIEATASLGHISGSHHYVRVYFGQSGLTIDNIWLELLAK